MKAFEPPTLPNFTVDAERPNYMEVKEYTRINAVRIGTSDRWIISSSLNKLVLVDSTELAKERLVTEAQSAYLMAVVEF